MKVIHSETYEREGNDSWLIDKIQIIIEDGELILRHKVNYKGWGGEDKFTKEVNLDEFDDLESKQKRVSEYMENNYLIPEMKVPNLEKLINKSH